MLLIQILEQYTSLKTTMAIYNVVSFLAFFVLKTPVSTITLSLVNIFQLAMWENKTFITNECHSNS